MFDFYIEYREGKKNPTDGLSYWLDYFDSSEAVVAKQALLASFLDRFYNRGSSKGARSIRYIQSIGSSISFYSVL